MAEKQANAPARFYQGESVSWSRSIAGYSSADGWSLKYYFRGPDGKLDVTAAPDGGGGFLVDIPLADTLNLVPGLYEWQAYVTKDAARHFVETGRTEVEASLETLGTHDPRSDVKKTLDAINAMIQGSASLDQKAYQIGNRRLDRIEKSELIKFQQHYAVLYEQERAVARARKGLPFFQSVQIRFRGSR